MIATETSTAPIQFLSHQRALVNMWMLSTHWAQPMSPIASDPSPGRLKVEFINSFNATHGTSIRAIEDGIHYEFSDESLLNRLVDEGVFQRKEILSSRGVFDESQHKVLKANVAGAIELLRDLDSGIGAMSDLICATIACFPVRRWYGGSASHFPGLVILSPRPKWTLLDYAGTIFHETIHQYVFLEDRARGFFIRGTDWNAREAQVYSAIRRTRRPIDMTFHADCVALGLMYFYHITGQEPKAQRARKGLLKSVAELTKSTRKLREQGKPYLTENGEAALDDLRKFCERPDYDIIAQSLRA
jgi:hypothetical protein